MDISIPAWQQFEDLVKRILEADNYVVRPHSPRGDAGFDFIGIRDRENWAIEVKFYRTARAQPTLIEAAANRLINNGSKANATKGMLVLSCILTPDIRSAFESKFSIAFVDRLDLRSLASSSPHLIEELDALVEADPGQAPGSREERTDPRATSKLITGMKAPPSEKRGAELCEELSKVKRGNAGWVDYETLCARILKYLFPNDLYGWHRQKRTDDGLNRFDFICRVRPTTEFWKFLIEHLNSRYVLFEFKNYRGKIKQTQILTTEKYLLEKGLRRVAIIISRAGAEKDAVKMTQGAMREDGKFMLIVNDSQVCEMLHMKDRGEDPSDCLFQLADDFLLTLPR